MSDRDKKEFNVVKYTIQRGINDLKFERSNLIPNIERDRKLVADTESKIAKDSARLVMLTEQIEELRKAAAELGIDVTDGTT